MSLVDVLLYACVGDCLVNIRLLLISVMPQKTLFILPALRTSNVKSARRDGLLGR